jgi:hypothetical protein
MTGHAEARKAVCPSVCDRVIASVPDRQQPLSRQLLEEQRSRGPGTGMAASGQDSTSAPQADAWNRLVDRPALDYSFLRFVGLGLSVLINARWYRCMITHAASARCFPGHGRQPRALSRGRVEALNVAYLKGKPGSRYVGLERDCRPRRCTDKRVE